MSSLQCTGPPPQGIGGPRGLCQPVGMATPTHYNGLTAAILRGMQQPASMATPTHFNGLTAAILMGMQQPVHRWLLVQLESKLKVKLIQQDCQAELFFLF